MNAFPHGSGPAATAGSSPVTIVTAPTNNTNDLLYRKNKFSNFGY